MENSFWNHTTDGNFVDRLNKSFLLYVESGVRKKIEIDIEILTKEQGGRLEPDDFQTKLHKIILDHYLRKLIRT
jgi:hypothetical protein